MEGKLTLSKGFESLFLFFSVLYDCSLGKSHMNLTWEMLPKVILLTVGSWPSWISITKYMRLGDSQTADIHFYNSKGWKS